MGLGIIITITIIFEIFQKREEMFKIEIIDSNYKWNQTITTHTMKSLFLYYFVCKEKLTLIQAPYSMFI